MDTNARALRLAAIISTHTRAYIIDGIADQTVGSLDILHKA